MLHNAYYMPLFKQHYILKDKCESYQLSKQRLIYRLKKANGGLGKGKGRGAYYFLRFNNNLS